MFISVLCQCVSEVCVVVRVLQKRVRSNHDDQHSGRDLGGVLLHHHPGGGHLGGQEKEGEPGKRPGGKRRSDAGGQKHRHVRRHIHHDR